PGAVREMETTQELTGPPAEVPFIGPHPFPPGRKLYGRDREVLALSQQLTAERVVLLYSPSGAGKTSLIQAALIPAMRDKGFLDLPTIRLNHPPPAPDVNRFVYSALLSLDRERKPEELLQRLRQAGEPSPLEIAIQEVEKRSCPIDSQGTIPGLG